MQLVLRCLTNEARDDPTSGLPFPAIGCPVMDIRRNYYIWNYLSSKLDSFIVKQLEYCKKCIGCVDLNG